MQSTDSAWKQEVNRRQGRRLLIGLAVAAIVLSGVRLGLVLKFMRGEAIESGERLTESFAQSIAEQTTHGRAAKETGRRS